MKSSVPESPSRIGLLWLRLFSYYLLATAVIYLVAVLFERSRGSDAFVSLLSVVGTTYMAASVRNYRKRILRGEPYPRSLKVFRAFYWAGVMVVVFASLVASHGPAGAAGRSVVSWLAAGVIVDIVWIVILSSLYSPVDIIWRLRVGGNRPETSSVPGPSKPAG